MIPYLFWNTFVLLLFLTAQSIPVTSDLFSGANTLIRNFNFSDFLSAYWNYNTSSYPIDYPFWFIRDLMAIVLLTPVVYWWVTRLKQYGVFISGSVDICFLLKKYFLAFTSIITGSR